MRFPFACALCLYAAASPALADDYRFAYTGFADLRDGGRFNPSVQLTGSFSGSDLNGDGVLGADELTALDIGSFHLFCLTSDNPFLHCHDEFAYSPRTGALRFVVALGEREFAFEAVSGRYFFLHGTADEFDYAWTPQTQLSLVPEPGRWGLLLAALPVLLRRGRRAGRR